MQGSRVQHVFVNGIESKQCSRCREVVPLTDFYSCKITSDGKRSTCKKCENQESKRNYRKDPARIIAKTRKWQAANPERVKENDMRRDKQKRNRWKRLWRQANPDKAAIYGKKHYQKLKESGYSSEYNRKWRTVINRDAYLAIRARHDNQRRTCIKKRIDHNFSTALWMALKSKKGGRKWESLVGYTLEQLFTRLSLMMPVGYSWDDYLCGKLHIDHIYPKSLFQYQTVDDEAFKKCWGLENLQLLPAIENIKKSNKIQSIGGN